MIRAVGWSLVVLAAVAGVPAQSLLESARLEMRIVPQTGTPPAAVTDVPGLVFVPAAETNRTRRFEVQYRIQGGAGVAAGLSSMQFSILGTPVGGSIGFRLAPARLSRFELQQAGASPPVSPDTSGLASGLFQTAAGMHRPFRTLWAWPYPHIPGNDNPANGIIPLDRHAINLITPLSLSQNDQGNINVGQDPNSWYGIYSFTIEVSDAATGIDYGDGYAEILLTATPHADSLSGNTWGGFVHENPIPQTSRHAVVGIARLRVEIPATGSLVVLGLGSLVAARRRRS